MGDAGDDSHDLSRIVAGLQRREKEIPFYLLYDDRGSELYKRITELESYYPFNAEKALFQKHALDIAGQISPDSLIVELGCGVADKTALLLDAIQAKHQRCHYVGIDVSQAALDEAESSIYKTDELQVELVCADYMDGLRIVRKKYPEQLICLLWLGSSIGNLSKSECTAFVNQILKIAGPRCEFFLCADLWKDASLLQGAYNDEQGVTERFIKNGMKHALELLSHRVSDAEEAQSWTYEVEINTISRQVEMYVRFLQPLSLPRHGIAIRKNERVLVEISRKFTVEDLLELSSRAGLVCQASWTSKAYGCFLTLSGTEAATRCWADTDKLLKSVGDWMAQPIPYRHPFCFYYGHVTAFTMMKLLQDESSSPLNGIFSRGMDPCMLDPSKCHKHPATPPRWPDRETLQEYTTSKREKVSNYLKAGDVDMKRFLLALEHERMHQETMAYMIAQQRKLDFQSPAPPARTSPSIPQPPKRNPDVLIPSGEVVLGKDPKPGVFRFDNEEPSFTTKVEDDFWLDSTPVSIGEFMSFVEEGCYNREDLWRADDFTFLKHTGQRFPATWSLSGEEYYVHFPDKSLPWTDLRDEPVYVSLMEAEAFSKWLGGRVMSEAEYKRALDANEEADKERVRDLKTRGWELTSSLLVPFDGFSSMQEYPEYSADFFDGLHYVLKGSSPATHVSMLRDSFRNFYQRQYPYAFAKFRTCRSATTLANGA